MLTSTDPDEVSINKYVEEISSELESDIDVRQISVIFDTRQCKLVIKTQKPIARSTILQFRDLFHDRAAILRLN